MSGQLKTDLNNILVNVAQSLKVLTYEVKLDLNLQVGDGFTGHFYLAEIKDKQSEEVHQIAIKRAPVSDFDYSLIYQNEVIFYQSIRPVLVKLSEESNPDKPFDHFPKLLSWSTERNQSYLVMENLKSQGYIMFPKENFFDQSHLEWIFTLYGRFHGLSMIFKAKQPKNFKSIHEKFFNIYEMMMQHSRKIFETCLQGAIDYLNPDSPLYGEVETLPKNITATFLQSCRYQGRYSCTVHGDCWSNNMMFKYGTERQLEDVKLVDFQLCRESTPIHDLSYFFYSGASESDLNQLEYYLDVYYKSLAETIRKNGENPDNIFPYNVLLSEWKENALFGVLMGVYLWQIKLSPKEDYIDDLKESADENGANNVEKLVKIFEKLGKTVKTKEFKERVVPLLTHAYEFGVLSKAKIVLE